MKAVACKCRENFLRDREDVSSCFAREAIVKDTGFVRTISVALKDHWPFNFLKILQRGAHRPDELDAIAALADVWFQDKWQPNFVYATESMQRKQAIGCAWSVNQIRICDNIDISLLKLLEDFVFRFADKSAGHHSGICRSRNGEAAIANREPYIVNGHGKVKEPRRPKLPMRPAANKCWQL